MRGAARREPMKTFFVKKRRNAEPRVLDRPFLDRVDERDGLLLIAIGRLCGCAGLLQILGPRELPDAVRIELFGFRWNEACPFGAVSSAFFARPHRSDLRDFFFQRHAGEQVFHSLLDGCVQVLVDRDIPACLCDTGGGKGPMRRPSLQ